MKPLPPRIIATAGDIAKDRFSEGQLELLLLESGLSDYMPADWYGKSKLVSSTILTAVRAADDLPEDTRRGLRSLVERVAVSVAPPEPETEVSAGSPFHRLREACRSCGFELIIDYEVRGDTVWNKEFTPTQARLLPIDNPEFPLSAAVTALEEVLNRRGMAVAVNCYQQAVFNLTESNFEACNGQLRAMFEDVIVETAVSTGFKRSRQGDGSRAIRHLSENGLPDGDGGEYIRGLWRITHTNGPHPGTSSAGEVQFRLHAITAACMYLLDRFPK